MDIIKEIKEAIDILDNVDEYISSLYKEQSILDEKEQDLLHYIENNKISTFRCYHIVKEIKNNRLKRRKVKQDIEIGRRYTELKNKMLSTDNRSMLIQDLYKKNNQLQTEYKNRQYTDEEIQKILKGV